MRPSRLLPLALAAATVSPAHAVVVVTIDDFSNAVRISSDNTPWDDYAATCANVRGSTTTCGASAAKPLANNAQTLFLWGPREDPATAGDPNPANSRLHVRWTGGGTSPTINGFRLLTPLDRDGNPLQRLGPQAGPDDFMAFGVFPINFVAPADAQDSVQQGAGVFATWGRDTSTFDDFSINPNQDFLMAMTIGSQAEVGTALELTPTADSSIWSPSSFNAPVSVLDVPLARDHGSLTNITPLGYSHTLVQGGAPGADTFELRFFDDDTDNNANPRGYLGDVYFQFNAPAAGEPGEIGVATAGLADEGAAVEQSYDAASTTLTTTLTMRGGTETGVMLDFFNQGGSASTLTGQLDAPVVTGTGVTMDSSIESGALELAETLRREALIAAEDLTDVDQTEGLPNQAAMTQTFSSGGTVAGTQTLQIDTVGPLLALSPDAGASQFGPGDVIDLGSIDVGGSTSLSLSVANLFGRDAPGIPDYGDLTTLTMYNVEFTFDVPGGDCPACFGLGNAGAFQNITLTQDSDAATALTIDVTAPNAAGFFFGTLSFYTDQNLAFGAGGTDQNPLTVRLRMDATGEPAPAPAPLALLGLGLGTLALLRRRAQRNTTGSRRLMR